MSQINPRNKDFQFFIEVWKKSQHISEYHVTWAQSQCKIFTTRRNQNISVFVNKSHCLYFVCSGLLAHCLALPSGKRKIMNLAYPGMALATTVHLYSTKRICGDLISLRSGTILALPYTSLLASFQEDITIHRLISFLQNKQLRFLYKLRNICWSLIPSERYRLFIVLLPEVSMRTSQYEQADLLGISRSCIQQQKRKLLFQKSKT
ncbi:MAG: hypothetical protein ACI35Z_04235 [Sphingobacterium hotanense]